VINSNLGPISHRLATIARTDLQDHSKSMIFLCHLKGNMRLHISD